MDIGKELTEIPKFSQWLFSQQAQFIIGATKPSLIPNSEFPEIAFIGRSNVGKSSLINALTNRKSLARTSNTPGRTQQLNFFQLSQHLMVVDMPGYGYARAPKPMVDAWQTLIVNYLQSRIPLLRVYVLIDARHGLKSSDLDFMGLLDQLGISYQAVLTKVDKVSQSDLASVMGAVQKTLDMHVAAYPQVLQTSSSKKWGIDELRHAVGLLMYEHRTK